MAKPTPNNPTGAQKSPKMTPEVIKKLEEVFAIDGSIEEACYYADISIQTYYNLVKKNPELLEGFERLRNKPILKARNTIVASLNDPNHAFKYVEKKRRKEFGNEEQQVKVDVNISLRDLLEKADEQK